MNKAWMKLVPELIDNSSNLVCPNCGKQMINYSYIGDENTRMGYLQVWCESCLVGIYISRVKAPEKAKMITFDQFENEKHNIPDYKFL